MGYFQSLCGNDFAFPSFEVNLADLVTNPISTEVATAMIREVSGDEICKVCFSLKANKAPIPDDFNAFFFQKAWLIIGYQIILAIQKFFNSTQLLRELNTTIITLVLKFLIFLLRGIFGLFLNATPFIKSSPKLWLI